MIGRTLSFYLAGRFTRTVLAAFGFVFALIYAIDLVEMLRRSGDAPKATAPLMALLSFLRTPAVAEQALPFAVLFGSMIAFLNLSRKLELVVARASGVSVWQILAPPLIVILLIGAASVALYNPASAWMKQRSDEIETSVFGNRSNPWGDVWLRQKSVDGQAIVHFNEVDECAGLDALFTNRVHRALGQPVETTLHDIRWGDADRSGTTSDYVWVFEISGAAPPAHHIGGWAGTDSLRQPPMYFRLGGGTVRGVAKPGPIVWSRIFVEHGRLKMDIGRAHVVALPKAETERRWNDTTPQWPIMHAVLHGVSRDQLMARHKANHIQVAYANSEADADLAMAAKASLASELGLEVSLCGAKLDGRPLLQ